VGSEWREEESQFEIDFANHGDVHYLKVRARESTQFTVGNDSAIAMHIAYADGNASTVAACGQNCLQLMSMFQKYLFRHMSP
jgi:hypothetical protein